MTLMRPLLAAGAKFGAPVKAASRGRPRLRRRGKSKITTVINPGSDPVHAMLLAAAVEALLANPAVAGVAATDGTLQILVLRGSPPASPCPTGEI